ncbi:MAG: hypothetical protein AAGE94_21705 [Acidobacteriota bacterium]
MKPPDINLKFTIKTIDKTARSIILIDDRAMNVKVPIDRRDDIVVQWTFTIPAGPDDIEIVELKIYPQGSKQRAWPGNGGVLKSTTQGGSAATASLSGKQWLQLVLDHNHMPKGRTAFTYDIVMSDKTTGRAMELVDVDPSMTLEPDGAYL